MFILEIVPIVILLFSWLDLKYNRVSEVTISSSIAPYVFY